MLHYRLKQFFWSLRHRLTESERTWINHTLTTDMQRNLFWLLHPADQAHAYRVAESLRLNLQYQKLEPWEKRLAAQLALLHDVGRAGEKFLIAKKVLHVILSLTPGTRHLAPLRNHEQIGVQRLQDAAAIEIAELLSKPQHPIAQIVRWSDNFN